MILYPLQPPLILGFFEDLWTILQLVPPVALGAFGLGVFLYYIFKEPPS